MERNQRLREPDMDDALNDDFDDFLRRAARAAGGLDAKSQMFLPVWRICEGNFSRQ